MNIRLNKEKSIGKVLYIVEGGKTEPYLLHKIFCSIMDYQLETVLRDKGYRKYNSKENPTSQVFVINAEESNIKNIARDNQFLDKIFAELIENYDFDVDNAAVYYLFDRDSDSNTDTDFIRNMLSVLANSRDNGFERQGMLLVSYPSIEAFTFSNFQDGSFNYRFGTGSLFKRYLHDAKINQAHITEDTLRHAVREILVALEMVGIEKPEIDAFGENNRMIFEYEENSYACQSAYNALSLLCISLIDLGVIDIQKI